MLRPGPACEALGVTDAHNGLALDRAAVRAVRAREGEVEIVVGPRIGLTKAVEKPWRYGEKGSRFLSKPFYSRCNLVILVGCMYPQAILQVTTFW